jgi:hypothetical protein
VLEDAVGTAHEDSAGNAMPMHGARNRSFVVMTGQTAPLHLHHVTGNLLDVPNQRCTSLRPASCSAALTGLLDLVLPGALPAS